MVTDIYFKLFVAGVAYNKTAGKFLKDVISTYFLLTKNKSKQMTSRTEKVYVLYGSQTGNSEEHAKTFCKDMTTKLSPSAIQALTGTKDKITVAPTHMQLDDFLELQKADWTRTMVIIVSSYGIGQAPLGSYRFRDLCDAWKERKTENVLNGVQFAMCGLGDSSYTTFFRNPTTIHEAMLQVGAQRVGPLGKADAKKTGNDSQANVIANWKNQVWEPLAQAISKPPLDKEKLQEMQDKTIELCCEINPDFEPPAGKGSANGLNLSLIVPVAVVLLAILAFAFKDTLMPATKIAQVPQDEPVIV